MLRYLRKQLTIIFVFLIILLAIGLAIYLIWRHYHPQPTCFDGIQNQGETGIDCGGPCGLCAHPMGLRIISQDFIPTTANNFDLVAKVENPNNNWGVESVSYKFNFYNANNQSIGSKEGSTYILPQETKYIVEQKIYLAEPLARIAFELERTNWQRLKDFTELQIRVKDKNHQIINSQYRLYGVLENKSNYNLDKVEIVGLLFDDKGKIIAAGKTDIRTFLINEGRSIEINWPYTSSDISSSEIKVYTNVFLDETFIKAHGTQEKFKEY